MEKYYKLGNLSFVVKGSDKTLPHIYKELESIEVFDIVQPNIIFDFNPPKKSIKDAIYVSPIITSSNEIIYSDKGFDFHIEERGSTLHVTIQSGNIQGIIANTSRRAFRLRHWNYLTPEELLAKDFMYNVFDFLTQIYNVRCNQSYIHASSFTKDQKAIAVVAWGGIGKTTSMLKLVSEQGWKFLSDDLGLIDRDGYLYRSPKKLQIYAYNLAGEPLLKQMLLKQRSLFDRINWDLRKRIGGVKRVRRRVAAEDLFKKNQIASKAKLTDAFFIERADVEEFWVDSIAVDELATRAANTVMSEIDPYHKIQSAIYTVNKESFIPSYSELYNQTVNVLTKSFENVTVKLVKIPLKATPDELAGFLSKQIEAG